MRKTVALAIAMGEAGRESGRNMIVMALASRKTDAPCRKAAVRVASEGYADRAYNRARTLVSRKIAGSPITDPARAAELAAMLAAEGKVRTLDGATIEVSVQSICCHGDTPGPPRIVRSVREARERGVPREALAGVAFRSLPPAVRLRPPSGLSSRST